MGNLGKAEKMLDAVKANRQNGHVPPDPDLVNKQRDLEQTKLLVAEVRHNVLSILFPADATLVHDAV